MNLQDSTGYLLNVSARLVKRQFDQRLQRYGLTPAQWALLQLLSREGRLSQADIAQRTHSDRATCGQVVDRLIAKGLLEKQLSPSDRRSYIVRLLPEGKRLAQEGLSLARDVNARALRGLSGAQRAALAECLDAIITNVEDATDES